MTDLIKRLREAVSPFRMIAETAGEDSSPFTSEMVALKHIRSARDLLLEAATALERGGWKQPDEITEDAIRSRARALVLKNGWSPGDKPGLHSVIELLTTFGLACYAETARCGYPECGCDFDAICADAIPDDPTTTALERGVWKPTHTHADGGDYMFLRHGDGRSDAHEPWSAGVFYEGADGRWWWTGSDRWFDRFSPIPPDSTSRVTTIEEGV